MKRGRDWNADDVKHYHEGIDEFMNNYHRDKRKVDCADLAIEYVIQFAKKERLHFEITSRIKPKTVKSEINFDSYDKFMKYATIHVGAENLADRPNTKPVSISKIKPGDFLLFDWQQSTDEPNIDAWHTMVIINRSKLWFGNVEQGKPTTIDWISNSRKRFNNGPEWYFKHKDLYGNKPRRWSIIYQLEN